MKPGLLWSFFGIALTGLSLGAQERPILFESMRAREIGPAGMSGRVSDVEVSLADRNIVYVGAATGGLFRSENGGISWSPIFDDQDALGIGAIAVWAKGTQEIVLELDGVYSNPSTEEIRGD